jgi:capsular exopolysaccharide synthesis family protein
VVEEPRSPVSDAFRLLRTNLEFLGLKNPLQVILITSPDVEDGKSTIASNLAASIAQSRNKRVILVDADLRKPTLHTGLGVENRNGLSEICLGTINIQDAMISWGYGELKLIPAGIIPPNPVELLSSNKFSQALDEMKAYADVIIIDSPPVFLADTLVLSGKVDGVLIVLRPGYTRKKSVVKLVDQFQKTGTNFTGVVLNRVAKSETYYSDYYRSQPDINEVSANKIDLNQENNS